MLAISQATCTKNSQKLLKVSETRRYGVGRLWGTMHWGRRSVGPDVEGYAVTGAKSLGQRALGQMGCGAQCTGTGGQWGTTLWDTASLGQNLWGRRSWGLGLDVLGQDDGHHFYLMLVNSAVTTITRCILVHRQSIFVLSQYHNNGHKN